MVLSTSAILIAIWTINTRVLPHLRSNLEFILAYLSFYFKSSTFGVAVFYIAYFFDFSITRMNKPNINNNIFGISSFRNRFNHPLAQTVSF